MKQNLLMPSWENAESPARAELVFEYREKKYGAYIIRLFYPDRIRRAFIYAAFGFVVVISAPVISEWLSNKSKEEFKATKEVVVNLTEPPPLDETPPPPPPPPPKQIQETVKFTPPKVVDKPVEEEQPPPQEKLSETTVSTETHEGEKQIDLPPEPIVEDEGKIFTFVEEQPSFPGGEEKLFAYLRANIKYPPIARENGIQGRIYVNFVVDKDGKIKDAKIARGGLGAGLEEEALRVVRAMPDWKAGKQNGRAVNVYFNLPINFTLK